MATYIVTTKTDELDAGATTASPGGTGLSLREAVALANNDAAADTITFDASVFTGGEASLIRLTFGEIAISDAVTIDASGAGGVIITGDKNNDDITEAGSEITDVTASLSGDDRLDDNSRIFVIDDLSPTTLTALTITGGRTTASNNLSLLPINNGGAIKSASDLTIIGSTVAGNSTKGNEAGGGAIYSGAKLTVDGSTVRDNLTSGQASGGAVMSVGNVTVSDSLFADNRTLNVTPSLLVSAGGAIAAVGQVEITNSTFSGNSVAADGAGGGAIIAGGNVILNGSTIEGNSVANALGGGIVSAAAISATNSTISGNTTNGASAPGAGLAAIGNISLINSTVSGNATLGANSPGAGISSNGTITLTNSIVLGNDAAQSTGNEIFTTGSVVANGLNIVGANQAAFDVTGHTGIVNANPASVFAQTVANGSSTAGVLGNNGGTVQTIALKLDATNPALDASNTSAPTTDAIGNTRFDQPGIANVNGSAADLGAAEAAEFPSLVVTTLDDVVDSFDGKTSLREAVAYANSKAGADTITFDASLAGVVRLINGELSLSETATIDGDSRIIISGDTLGDDSLAVGFANISDVAATLGAGTGGDNVRILNSSADLTVKNITLTGGMPGGQGGAISAAGDVTVLHSIIMGNAANDTSTGQASGGAIINGGDVIVTDSIISGNYSALGSPSSAGGIAAGNNAIITNSTISFNYGAYEGGGLLANGTVTLLNATVTGNVSGTGGGIIARGGLIATNSIILGNTAFQDSEFQSNNLAPIFNGINIVGTGNDADASDGVINADPTKIFASTVSVGGFNIPAVQAGVLADNGGYVPTVALKLDATNPALDASDATGQSADARGQLATDIPLVGSNAPNPVRDLGAFEAVDPTVVIATPVLTSIAENTSTAAAIKFAGLTVIDPFNQVSLALSGADASLFEIHSDGIFLKAGSVLDFETNPALDVTLTADRAGLMLASSPATFLVTDVNEAPTAVALSNTLASIAENASTAARRKIADIGIFDDALGTETLTLTGADASKFEIFNGDLYLRAGATLDFEGNPKLDVTVNVDDTTLGSGIELSRALSVNVTDVLETISGSGGSNTLNGANGADRILAGAGNDTVNGGGGDDILQGGAGVDKLTGGTGRDTFLFASLTDSGYHASGSLTEKGPLTDQAAIGQRDIITDFTPGFDKIDLSGIDANSGLSGNQAFTFRGTGNFAGAGSLVYRKFDNAGTANDRTIIFADVTGDGRSDFQIELTGLKTLSAGDFVL